MKQKLFITQSCPNLCNPMNYNLPGSSVHGLLQVRILEWVAISFSRGSSQPRDWTQVSWIVCRFFTFRAIPICKDDSGVFLFFFFVFFPNNSFVFFFFLVTFFQQLIIRVQNNMLFNLEHQKSLSVISFYLKHHLVLLLFSIRKNGNNKIL